MYKLQCIECGRSYPKGKVIYQCEKCGGLLEVAFEERAFSAYRDSDAYGVWKYRGLLPIDDESKIVSLREGNTPLYECGNLAGKLGMKGELRIKNEGANPTGSFKDRGVTVGITRAIELGAGKIGCASTGNTSASLAAYAAKAGLKCYIFVPAGKIAFGKLSQALIYGAEVYAIKGNFDDAMRASIEAGKDGRFYLLNSINPYRGEGQKTIAFEVADELGGEFEKIDRVIVPVGNAANISAIWKGLKEFRKVGRIKRLPKMTGIQAEGAAPVYRLFKSGEYKPVAEPETIASAIRIGNPVSWKKAINAVRESGGSMAVVSDEEILDAQHLLASSEGIFVEPASAAGIAGLRKLVAEGEVAKDENVVCVTTGSGLKDPNAVVDRLKGKIKEVGSAKEIAW